MSAVQYIENFTNDIIISLKENLLGLANELWISYYSLILIPLVIWFAVTGVRYMSNQIKGEKLYEEIQRILLLFIWLLFGYFTIPLIEYSGDFIETTMIENYLDSSIYKRAEETSKNQTKKIILDETAWDDITPVETLDLAYNFSLFKSTNLNGLSKTETTKLEEFEVKHGLSSAETVSPPVNLSNIESSSEISTKKWIANLITSLLLIIGAILKCLMLVFRVCLLVLFRFTFPIALALSFIPDRKDTLKNWLENYISVVLLGVIISLINIMSKLIIDYSNITLDDSAIWSTAFMSFVLGIFYLLSPTLATLTLNASSTMSQLPNQIIQASAGIASIATFLPKTAYKLLKKDNKKTNSGSGGSNDNIQPTSL